MTISKEINCAEHEYMNIGPPNYRSSGAPGIDESQLQKALESLLSDDSDDASIADDTSQNLPSKPKEIGAGKNLRNQHGKHGETASNSKTSKHEIEESII